MRTYHLTVPITKFFSYDSTFPDKVYSVTMPWGPSGTGGTTLNAATAVFVEGTVVRLPDAAANPANDSAEVTVDAFGETAVFDNSSVTFTFTINLDPNQPSDTVDTVILTFNIFLSVNVPAAGVGSAIQVQPALSVTFPEGVESASGQTLVVCTGPSPAATLSPPPFVVLTSPYPPTDSFSAAIDNQLGEARKHDATHHGEGSIIANFGINITGSTTPTAPASTGVAVVQVSILF